MAFQIGRAVSKETATRFDLYYDTDFTELKPAKPDAHPLNADEEPCGVLTFYLTHLTGRAQREISDQMMNVSKRGKSKMMAGSAEMIRMVHATVEIQGLEGPNGRPVTELDGQIFDALDRWVIERVLAKIHEMNGTGPDDDDEDGEGKGKAPFSKVS